jgi:hypothetical protein
VLSGARAVFETLALVPGRGWLLWLYFHLPGVASVSEAAYRLVAANRNLFYRLTVMLFGRAVEPLRYDAVAGLFRRWLAVIWLIAFLSFGVQAQALIGSQGVLPVGQYLARVREFLGPGAWIAAPSLLWLDASDTAIQAVWLGGCAAAVLVFFGWWWRAAMFACFALYLSLLNVSQDFLGFQWDILLLETGFLAIFLGYSRVVVWMFRWLLFRLMFLSGAVKLRSGDPTWRNGTALLVHFQTQPIPTPLAWYAHQLPPWFLIASCWMVFFIELLVPLLVFAPRRVRLFALPWLLGLQVLILLTGNYAFFNWLSIGLCLFLLDDRLLPWVRAAAPVLAGRVRRKVAWSVAALVAVLSSLFVAQTLRLPLPALGRSLISTAAPFGITSTYGLFATMTTSRPEIVIEGSRDGAEWREYEFQYKPGRLDRRPPWVAPHQPRLDWQMWFAALGSYRENAWFLHLVMRLLENDRTVLAQLGPNPFPEAAPRYVRARLYEYRFTNGGSDWWTRTPAGLYLPAVTLEDLRAALR